MHALHCETSDSSPAAGRPLHVHPLRESCSLRLKKFIKGGFTILITKMVHRKYVQIKVTPDVKELLDQLVDLYSAVDGRRWTYSQVLRRALGEEVALYIKLLEVLEGKTSIKDKLIRLIRDARDLII